MNRDNVLNIFYSKCGKYRIRTAYTEEKTFFPDEDDYYRDCTLYLISKNFFPSSAKRLTESEASLKKRYKSVVPVYAYSHGGVRLSTWPFSCPWDSGHIGFCCSDDYAKAKEYIEEWDTFLNEPAYDAVLEEQIKLYTEDGTFYREEWKKIESSNEYPSEREAFDSLAPKGTEFQREP